MAKHLLKPLILALLCIAGTAFSWAQTYNVVNTLDVDLLKLEQVGYSASTTKFDVDAVKSSLGLSELTAATCSAFIVNVSDGSYNVNTTDGWRNAQGDMALWGSSAGMICAKMEGYSDVVSTITGKLWDIMAIDDTYVAGNTYTAKWAIVNKSNNDAVIINLNITFATQAQIDEATTHYRPTIVKTIQLTHKEKPGISLQNKKPYPTFDVDEVKDALGVSDLAQCQTYVVNVSNGDFVEDEFDGWHNAQGDGASWGESANGYCLKLTDPSSGTFSYAGAHDTNFAEGDSYVVKWGLVYNEKAVVLEVTILFGNEEEEAHNYNVVGTQDITLDVYAASAGQAQPNGTATFDLNKVFTDLGVTDASTLTQLIVNVTDGSYNSNSTDGWRNAQGDMASWGSSTGMVCVKLNDISSGTIDWIGFIDNTHTAGETYTAKWAIANGNDDVEIINVILNFVNAPQPPTVVKTISVDFAAPANQTDDYGAGIVTFNLDEVLTALGESDLSNLSTSIVNVTTGEFVNNSTDGWRGANGDAASWGNTGGVCVKLNDLGSATFDYIGFFDTTHNAGEVYHAQWGVVNKNTNEAVVLDLAITFYNPVSSLTQLSEAGTAIERTIESKMQGYVPTEFTIDPAAVAATLGCTTAQLKLFARTSTDDVNAISNTPSAGNQGYWLTAEGIRATYGTADAQIFLENTTNADFSTFRVGIETYAFSQPQTLTLTLYFVNEVAAKYVALNIVINLTATDIVLNENMTTLPEAVGVANVTLTRAIYSGWNTMVLPFDISVNELNGESAFYDTIDELGIFAGDATDAGGMTHLAFTKLADDAIVPANTPFLVYYADSDNDAYTFNFQNVNLINVEANPASAGTDFDFQGTYTSQTGIIAAGDYYLGSKDSFYKASSAKNMLGFRAFLKSKGSSAAKANRISFDFDGVPTDITSIDGQATPTVGNECYTIAGQRVAAPTQKGLYIIGGKKVLVK